MTYKEISLIAGILVAVILAILYWLHQADSSYVLTPGTFENITSYLNDFQKPLKLIRIVFFL